MKVTATITAIALLLAICPVRVGNSAISPKKFHQKRWHHRVVIVKVTYYKPHNSRTAFGKKPSKRVIAYSHWQTVPKGAAVSLAEVKENGRWRKISSPNKGYVLDKTARRLWNSPTPVLDYCEPSGVPRSMIAAVNAKLCRAEISWYD